MSELSTTATTTQELTESAHRRLKRVFSELRASRTRSWRWCVSGFEEGLEWLLKHPHDVHCGVYMSDTPGKEVWHLALPKRFGPLEVVYKMYLQPMSLWDMFEESDALRESRNYAVLESLGVRTAEVLACGEQRSLGTVVHSFIVTRFIPDTINGSWFMPGGVYGEDADMRMAFSRKTLETIALTHQCRFFHNALHPHKILVRMADGTADSMELTFIDVTSAGFRPKHGGYMLAIARDLLTLFVDLRLSSDEIKLLCAYYIELNPTSGFTPDSLWRMLVSLG